MIDKVLISEGDLNPYLKTRSLPGKLDALQEQQKETWQFCSNGYMSLETCQIKVFEFKDFIIKVQYNPARIISTSAGVDSKSINDRKCFLCYANLPEGQKGIGYKNNYLILCNPFPIFNKHFTVPSIEHLPQLIEDSFSKLLSLSKDLGKDYSVFYNGPKCGASAPDHLHFQIGNSFYMPIDSEYEIIKLKLGTKLIEKKDLGIYAVDNYLRRFFAFESNNKETLLNTFEIFYSLLEKISMTEEEPMMNILCRYEDEKWRIIIFPRSMHRPSYYFSKGEDNVLISPASVDLGGILITPLEKDFIKINKDLIVDIYNQVTISTEYFEFIKMSLIKEISIKV
jgi:hypothetical protein